jgi:hypothetical protein
MAVETILVSRCELRPQVKRLLGGTKDHRVPLLLGERCPTDLSDLAAETSPPSGAWVERSDAAGKRLEVRLGRVPARADAVELRLLRASTRTVIGTTRLDVRASYAPRSVVLTDPALGEVPVIPTNREVRLQWASEDLAISADLEPVALPGFYSVRRDGRDVYVKGEARTEGAVAVRFAYRAIGIHAWLEYAPTRKGGFADQLAFIFGPSVSLGDFGVNL